MGVNNGRVSNQASYVVVSAGALILLFGLYQAPANGVENRICFRLCHVCHSDICRPDKSSARVTNRTSEVVRPSAVVFLGVMATGTQWVSVPTHLAVP